LESLIDGKQYGKLQFETIDSWENNIYAGTSDGHLVHFIVERNTDSSGSKYEARLNLKQSIGRKPIDHLAVVPSQKKLLLLCDATFYVFHLATLKPVASINPIRGILCFCFFQSENSICEICLGKKKAVSIYELNDRLTLDQEITVPDAPILLSQYKNTVCYADGSIYRVLDTATKEIVELFPYDIASETRLRLKLSTVVKPHIKFIKVKDGEFLLSTTSQDQMGLGMFVSLKGAAAPEKGTIQWSSVPFDLGYRYPYVISLGKSAIEIHNILDQKLQQSIEFTSDELRCICNQKDRFYVASKTAIHFLLWTPIDNQIDALLKAGRVDDAVALTVNMQKSNDDPDGSKKKQRLKSVYQKAGFISLNDGNFEKSLDFFLKGALDPRILISLFPDFCPKASTFEDFRKTIKQNFGFEDIGEIVEKLKSKTPIDTLKSQTIDLLKNYLEKMRSAKVGSAKKEEIDTCLTKIYVLIKSPQLYTLLQENNESSLEQVEQYLKENEKHYALSLLYKSKGLAGQALDLWKQMTKKQLLDPDFAGLEVVINYLALIEDERLIWEHSNWVFEYNPILAVKIFTSSREKLYLQPSKVLQFFASMTLDEEVQKIYLEDLIHEKKNKEETYHTSLALIYFQRVRSDQLKLQNKDRPRTQNSIQLSLAQGFNGDIDEAFSAREDTNETFEDFLAQRRDQPANNRLKLMKFLKESTHYSAGELLSEVKDWKLYAELAILYSRIDQHEKALELLVYMLKDFVGAEKYCQDPQAEDEYQRVLIKQTLYLSLLKVYLKPPPGTGTYQDQITHLLNDRMTEMDAAKVLEILPGQWSLNILSQFLIRTLCKSHYTHSEGQIVKNLSKSENLQLHVDLAILQNRFTVITEETICQVCKRHLDESVFARYPNGVVAHVHCTEDKHICPVTKINFKTDKKWKIK